MFQAPEKVLFAEDTNRKSQSLQLYSLLGFSSVLKRFKIGVEVVFLDDNYILKIIVGTMVKMGLLVFNSTLKMFVRTMLKKFNCVILTLGIFVEIMLNSFSVEPTSSSECF